MLVDEKTTEAFGPFLPSNGATVTVGERTLVLQMSRTKREQTEALLKNIIIPSIEFRQANLKDVIHFLVEASLAADPEREGANIVLSRLEDVPAPALTSSSNEGGVGADVFHGSPTAADRTITLNLRRVTLYDAIATIAEVAGLKWEITEGGVVIVHGAGSEHP